MAASVALDSGCAVASPASEQNVRQPVGLPTQHLYDGRQRQTDSGEQSRHSHEPKRRQPQLDGVDGAAALSFLGLGIPPPDPSWGNMLGGILVASFKPPWWLVAFPGAAITVTILAFNLFGDALRDHLDPKLRGRLD
ncbi:MAG: ABC transporter permease subunit [Chloroflexi bacterium]|nr:ABC transporter permease subunit [Chloroflexota bacterium]